MPTRRASFAIAPLFALALCRPIRGQEAIPSPAVTPPPPKPPDSAADSAGLLPAGVHNDLDDYAKDRARLLAAKWSVEIDVQFVGLTQDRALPLIPRFLSGKPDQVDAACKQIDEMIARKEATLIAWPRIICLDGQRSVVESIVEQRYPTEFELPYGNYGKSIDKPVKEQTKDQAAEPTMFETRNVGTTLEAETTVLDEGRTLLVNLVPQHVALRKFENFATAKGGNTGLINQPIFTTSKITTAVKVANGQRLLLAVHKHEGEADQVQFMILHATATRVEH